jgi:hypothetical protein
VASECGQSDHVHDRHLLVANWIARREGAAVAQSGIIDQEIDINPFMIQPCQQFIQLGKIGEINFAKRNRELRILAI